MTVRIKAAQTKHIGKAIAILTSVANGHSPQSAGQVEQPSSSSHASFPQTARGEKAVSKKIKEDILVLI